MKKIFYKISVLNYNLQNLMGVHSTRFYLLIQSTCEQEEDLDMTGSARKTKFSRLSWGLEIWDLLHCAVELVYEPELQVNSIFSKSK
jgi:hypothetical protein